MHHRVIGELYKVHSPAYGSPLLPRRVCVRVYTGNLLMPGCGRAKCFSSAMPTAGGTASIVTTPLRSRNDALNNVCTCAMMAHRKVFQFIVTSRHRRLQPAHSRGGVFEPATAGSVHGRLLEFEGVGPSVLRGMVCPYFFNNLWRTCSKVSQTLNQRYQRKMAAPNLCG